MSWSAKQYVTFEQERTRPARDLLAAIPSVEARSVIDLGCGPGNSTELLVEHFPGATVRGLDSSADMIEAARQRLPAVTFDTADIGRWNEPGPFDVIFANAVLQWLPDHATLLPSLVDKLAEGGSLAVQMPDNLHQPSHQLMREIAATAPGPPHWPGWLICVRKSRTPALITRSSSPTAPASTCGAPPITIHWPAVPRAWWSGSRAALCGRFSSGWIRRSASSIWSVISRRSNRLIPRWTMARYAAVSPGVMVATR